MLPRTSNTKAIRKRQRLFIDTPGPSPRNRGGMKYWACPFDNSTDFTLKYFSKTKNKLVEFVGPLIIELKGLNIKVEFFRYNNTGEHKLYVHYFGFSWISKLEIYHNKM